MARSFSVTDYKGGEVNGTVLWEDPIKSFVLVEEDSPATGPCLWIVDTLDDVGVSLNAEGLRAMLPHMQKWLEAQ
jgi:hypothetical protein